RRAREVLVDELGVDLSPELQQLELDLLAQAPALAGPATRLAPPQAGGMESAGLVGRDDVLTLVRDQVALLGAGTGSTTEVTGEAGIGKTRVVLAAAQEAEQGGVRVLWGRCHEADVSPAYWPWVPVVRALAGATSAPEVAALLAPTAVAPALDADSAALRTYDAVTRLLVTAAAEHPLLVVLEDIHWADASSLRLLTFAAEALAAHPVLLVATLCPTEGTPRDLQTA